MRGYTTQLSGYTTQLSASGFATGSMLNLLSERLQLKAFTLKAFTTNLPRLLSTAVSVLNAAIPCNLVGVGGLLCLNDILIF